MGVIGIPVIKSFHQHLYRVGELIIAANDTCLGDYYIRWCRWLSQLVSTVLVSIAI